ncbi:MAG TPA: nickel-dependent lactate racemase, partial [Elusimicrobia bacterium]|nr:nickel-dependent lactate racemase [Elusimicrobiota bacterium]
ELSTQREKITNPREEIKKVLKNPIGSEPLKEIAEKIKPNNLVIIVEDITRPNPDYREILDSLIEELKIAGISDEKIRFIIAYGTHRQHRAEENKKIYGEALINRFQFIDHNPDADDLISLGKLSTGNELWINKYVAQADFLIATGNIEPHAFAGYGGGRKAILPGVSGRKTITKNHSKVCRRGTEIGKLENNPIHEEMLEAAHRVASTKPFFILNVIRNSTKEIIGIVAGDFEKAFFAGIKIAQSLYSVTVPEKAEVVISSCGGYPKDINLYQSQKTITASAEITKEGGTIVLLAECRDGVGQPVFEKWLRKHHLEEILHKKEEDIEVEGHRAYLTAKILKKCEVIVVSSLAKELVEEMHFSYKKDINEILSYLRKKHGNNFKTYIIPNGAAILPIVK